MSDSSRNNNYDDIFKNAPNHGDWMDEDFDYLYEPNDAYEKHLVEERIEQIQNSTITEESDFLPPAIKEQATGSINSQRTEEYSLEFYLAKERDRLENFLNGVDADETRCLLRDCP